MLGNNQLLRAMFESALHGIAVLDHSGLVLHANRSLERMLGEEPGALIGTLIGERAHPEDRSAIQREVRRLLNDERIHAQSETRCVRRDGSFLWVRLTLTIHRELDRAPVVCMVEDISDRRAAEELRAQLTRDLGERVKELSAVHGAARVLLVSSEPLGARLKRVAELLPPSMQYPETTTACIRLGEQAYATPGHVNTPWLLQVPFRTSDGMRAAIEVAYQAQRPAAAIGPFLLEERTLLESIGEMTQAAIEREASVQALQRANERFNLALDTANMGVWEWDVATNVTTWSTQLARMVGLDAEIVGNFMGHKDLVHPDDYGPLRERLVRAAEGTGTLDSLEFRLKHPNGGWRHMAGGAQAVRCPTGGSSRIVAALVDVTARRALENGLRQAQKVEALGVVAAGVAHDFNNVLTILLGGVQMLRSDLGEAHASTEILDDLRDATERGRSLTQLLLTFSRRSDFTPTVVDVNALLTRLQPLLRRIAPRQVQLQVDLHPDAGSIRADAGQLEQLVMNLVVNACDAMPNGGVLHVATRPCTTDEAMELTGRRDPHTALTVRDTGTGIDPETRARIFEPFFTTKEPGKGTGLGLAIIADVAKRWHGHVSLDSALGEGTSFHVMFPTLPTERTNA